MATKSAVADFATKHSEIGKTDFGSRLGRILRGSLRSHLRMTV
jgi:hypothetical protein